MRDTLPPHSLSVHQVLQPSSIFYSYKSSCFKNLSSFHTQHFSSSTSISFLHGILHFLFIQPFCFHITTLFSYIRLLHWCLHSKKRQNGSHCEDRAWRSHQSCWEDHTFSLLWYIFITKTILLYIPFTSFYFSGR